MGLRCRCAPLTTVVVIPSRGRPDRAREAVQAIRDTAALVSTSVILAVDADDPTLPEYRALHFRPFGPEVTTVVLQPDETGSLTKATNTISLRIAEADPDCIIGNLGDDHIARTPGWDVVVEAVLRKPGIAYGRDGVHDAHMPTAPFISAAIVLALGYYALPDCAHMYIDDAWKAIGYRAGIITYCDELLFEHMHAAVGKAEWDDGYRRVTATDAVERDRVAFEAWKASRLSIDAIRARNAAAVPA